MQGDWLMARVPRVFSWLFGIRFRSKALLKFFMVDMFSERIGCLCTLVFSS